MENNNVMQQQETTNLVQMTEAINEIVPAGSTVTVDVPAQPSGYTNITQNYVPSNKSKVVAFVGGSAIAGLGIGSILLVRWLAKRHKAKKAAAAAQVTTTEVPQNEEFVEV